jgi:hypothetical protein
VAVVDELHGRIGEADAIPRMGRALAHRLAIERRLAVQLGDLEQAPAQARAQLNPALAGPDPRQVHLAGDREDLLGAQLPAVGMRQRLPGLVVGADLREGELAVDRPADGLDEAAQIEAPRLPEALAEDHVQRQDRLLVGG